MKPDSACTWCGSSLDPADASCRACPTPRDDEASRLFAAHVSLARHIANKYRRIAKTAGLKAEDLEQEALVGLWHACRRFDPARGCRFSTYAYHCIRGLMLAGVNRFRFGVAGGEKGRGFDHSFRLRSCVGPNGEDRLAENTHTGADDVIADVEQRERFDMLSAGLGDLVPRERAVITDRLLRDHTLEQVGNRFGVTKERIRQIQNQAMGRLTKKLVAMGAESA